MFEVPRDGSHSCLCVTSAWNTRGKVSGDILIHGTIFSHTHKVLTLFFAFITATRADFDGEHVEMNV